jgi:hypothetical protein
VLSWAAVGFALLTTSVAAWQPDPGCSEGSAFGTGNDRHARITAEIAPELIADKYDGSVRRRPGRPVTRREIEARVVRMAPENRDWGYLRIQRALSNPGHELARTTIANILKRNAIGPSLERARKTTWKEFLTQYLELIVAADFFTVEVWTRKGPQRFLALFFIELSTRDVQIAGISARASGLWMSQITQHLTDCLKRMMLFGEDSPRTTVQEFTAHDHCEGNHQRIGNLLILPNPDLADCDGPIRCRRRLDGMLSYTQDSTSGRFRVCLR